MYNNHGSEIVIGQNKIPGFTHTQRKDCTQRHECQVGDHPRVYLSQNGRSQGEHILKTSQMMQIYCSPSENHCPLSAIVSSLSEFVDHLCQILFYIQIWNLL